MGKWNKKKLAILRFSIFNYWWLILFVIKKLICSGKYFEEYERYEKNILNKNYRISRIQKKFTKINFRFLIRYFFNISLETISKHYLNVILYIIKNIFRLCDI